MKKIIMFVFCLLVALLGSAEARRVEINLALPSTMAASGTSPFEISSMSQDAQLFGILKEISSGTGDFILSSRGGMLDPAWAIQVVSATQSTAASQANYTLAYKIGDIDNTSTEWGKLPLIPIISGVSTNSGATPYPLYFDPPPGKYMRFYITAGSDNAFATFTAKVTVTENAKIPDPNSYIVASDTYTDDYYVRTQPGFFHGIWVSGTESGVTIYAYDISSGTTTGVNTLFPETYIPLSTSNPYGVINCSPPILYNNGIHVGIVGTGSINYKVYYRDRTN